MYLSHFHLIQLPLISSDHQASGPVVESLTAPLDRIFEVQLNELSSWHRLVCSNSPHVLMGFKSVFSQQQMMVCSVCV